MFIWRWLGAEGQDVGSSSRFRDQRSAENWMAEEWADLLDRGVHTVVLLDDAVGREAYRMGLAPAAADGPSEEAGS